jgi:hypothetical protein
LWWSLLKKSMISSPFTMEILQGPPNWRNNHPAPAMRLASTRLLTHNSI